MGDIRDTFPNSGLISWGRNHGANDTYGTVISVTPGVENLVPATPNQDFKQYEIYQVGSYQRNKHDLPKFSDAAIKVTSNGFAVTTERPVAIQFSDVYVDKYGNYYRGHQQQGFFKSNETMGHGVTLGRGLWATDVKDVFVASQTWAVSIKDFTHFTKLTPIEIAKIKAAIATSKEDGYVLNEDGTFSRDHCFLAGTMIDMWPTDQKLKPEENWVYNEKEVRAKVWQKPIEEVTPDDWVISFDKFGHLKPGRVKRTFINEAKVILDLHGTFVTPGHVYYCAGGTYEGRYVPIIDILRDDGIVQHENGSLIRATSGCEVDSEDDKQIWTFLLYVDKDGTERVRDKCQLRLGSRWMLPTGKHFSLREYMDGIGIELIEEGPQSGYVRFKETGLITVFAWTLSDTLPQPEDFVLKRSQTTLEEIYRAAEWESVHPQAAAPLVMDSGPVQPLSMQQMDDMPRNNPMAFQNNTPSSKLRPHNGLNRKARKAQAAQQQKMEKTREKAHKSKGTVH